jgi:hypothetical protein
MAGRLRPSRILFNPFCFKAQPYAGLCAFQEITMTENNHIASDNQTPVVPLTGLESWFEKDRDYARRASDLLPANKAVLFDRLAAAGITSDGYGDSGQIEDTEAKAGNETVQLPNDRIENDHCGFSASCPPAPRRRNIYAGAIFRGNHNDFNRPHRAGTTNW